jgi:hypothetical protein
VQCDGDRAWRCRYLIAEAGTGRAFVSRGTHVMVVDGFTEKMLRDIMDTP